MKGNVLRAAALLVLSITSLTGISCGETEEDRLAVFPVSGKVLVNNQPADGSLVVFHPVEPLKPEGLRPSGYADDEGNFTLGTYESGDGAPAGQYVVTVVWPEPPAGPMPDPDLAPDRLRGRYASPETSPLRAEVQEQETVLPPLQITSAGTR